MGYIITEDQHREFARKTAKILSQVGQREYPFNPELALEALQSVIEGRFQTSSNSMVYSVIVDYNKTVEEMVLAGHYNWSNSNINSRNFPFNGTGKVSVICELVHLDKVVRSKDVLSYMEANSLRPATVEELLMFGVTYPDTQREFSIMCLGSSWSTPVGNCNVPYLYRDGSNRNLNLIWFGGRWHESCRFLAVRKSNILRNSHIIDTDAFPVVPSGWLVEEHKRGGQFLWDSTNKVVFYYSSEQKNGNSVGHDLRKEIVNQPVLNANVLDYLLVFPELIPESWKGRSVFFWGTVYRGFNHGLYVRYLCWTCGRWGWDYRGLNDDWGNNSPAVVLGV